LSQKITVEIDPVIDIKKQGLLNLLIIYFIQNLLDKKEINFPYQNNSLKTKPLAQTIVCIQSESFFDARRLSPCIKQNLLPAFEQCKTTADYYGELEVPAWGANTMRTEFSFLTGLNNQELRFKKFYPHFFYKNKAIPSLISALKALNYYTLCVHPHPAQFFQRGAFFKQLGFDEFIDINAFSKNQKSGPYIGDKAITEKIKQSLEIHSNKKLFIFAITMENHGPLHLETVLANESSRYLNQAQTTPLLNDLIIYLRHLNNADQMIKDLLDELKAKDGLCCFYGDHLPNMNAIFQQFEFENNKTDYFIFLSKQRSNIKKQITIEQLSGLFFSR
jgi:phosphoglycerol transferase MdoB-like AlkP superfamily enzyme